MADLIFEIGLEEMPARFVRPAMASLKQLAAKHLAELDLTCDSLETTGTPRRLALMVSGLLADQPERVELALGPPVKNAFDADGKPTKAAQGFAKSQGVAVEDLGQHDTDKGPRLGVSKTIPGRPAHEVLSELLPTLVGEITFPKTMRWGSQSFRFARPIHWFLAVLDGRVVPFELAGIKSGKTTRGHRFMAPGEIEVLNPSEYADKLREAHVLVDRDERFTLTQMEVETTAQVGGGKLVPDEELLQEVTDLVELPVACCGTFDPEFLEVPREVIISAMREHQRYFALEDADGKLLNKFIAVNNTKPKDLAVVTAGHEKVLRARLSDARFFLTEDMKRPLIDYLEDLKQVTYHAKLGTSFEKVERFTALAKTVAEKIAPDKTAQVERAARLAKCDLVTEMVGEFPDLQGVVGTEYARRNGEDDEVAEAIRQHYLPAGAGSELPASMVGVCVGLGDRLDTICGMFGIGKAPTGAADPFGLRRAAIGVIRIITEKGITISLGALLDQALANLGDKVTQPVDQVRNDILAFFATRCQGLLTDAGVPTDVADAVLAAGLDDLTAAKARALALAQVKETEDFKPLAIGMKRVMNILRKEANQVPTEPADLAVMTEDAEKALYQAFQALAGEARARFAEGEYLAFLQALSALKGPIDKFFDDVLVMDPDEKVRANRLAMLNEIAGMFRQVAEFTHLQLA
jgi:glycyl-tRNA synthetase beta chain